MDVKVRITNLPQIRRAFGMAPTLMTRNLNIAIKQSVYQISRHSRTNTPVDTGRLRASHYERFNNLRGEVGTNTNYDFYVHQGTRYMKGRPYLVNAVNNADQDIQNYMKIAVQATLNAIGKMT